MMRMRAVAEVAASVAVEVAFTAVAYACRWLPRRWACHAGRIARPSHPIAGRPGGRPIAGRPGYGGGYYRPGWGYGAAAVGAAAAYGAYGYYGNNYNCYYDSYGQYICPQQYQY